MKKPKWWWRLYFCKFCFIPSLRIQKLRWKDKFGSPRCEEEPLIRFEWLCFGLLGIKGTDDYWEQWLWVHKYCGGDVIKAKETWGWSDYYTHKSTWRDEYTEM